MTPESFCLAQLDKSNIRQTEAFGLFCIACLTLGCASSGSKIIHGKDYNSTFDFYFNTLGDTIRHGPLTGYFTEVNGANAEDAEDAGKIHWTATYVGRNLHGPYKIFFQSWNTTAILRAIWSTELELSTASRVKSEVCLTMSREN